MIKPAKIDNIIENKIAPIMSLIVSIVISPNIFILVFYKNSFGRIVRPNNESVCGSTRIRNYKKRVEIFSTRLICQSPFQEVVNIVVTTMHFTFLVQQLAI